MGESKSTVTMDDLMAYAQESQELGTRHKVPGEAHLMHLLAAVAREAEEAFGEKGLEMIERAVARFGEERGRRIAQTARDAGKPLTLMNFFLFSDLVTTGHEIVPELIDGEFHVRVNRCSLADRLTELGLEKYGKHYCKPIDIAILKGYNPRLRLELEAQITLDADHCHFVYRQPPGAAE